MADFKSLMEGKKGLIMGLANSRSIAWGIAKALHDSGAELALTYQGDAIFKKVKPLAEELNASLVLSCDMNDATIVEKTFDAIQKQWGRLDFLVHAIAFSDKDELKGRYVDTTRENFLNTMDVSCYSFTVVSRYAAEMMQDGGSLLTLTYHGSTRVMPHYNVMGVAKAALEASVRYMAVDLGKHNIRVNGLSAGPLRTLASAGISDFRYILKWNEYNAPLKRNVTLDDVGCAALYLLSPLSSGVTGEIHHVDCGYHVVGMKAVDAPDITTVHSSSV